MGIVGRRPFGKHPVRRWSVLAAGFALSCGGKSLAPTPSRSDRPLDAGATANDTPESGSNAATPGAADSANARLDAGVASGEAGGDATNDVPPGEAPPTQPEGSTKAPDPEPALVPDDVPPTPMPSTSSPPPPETPSAPGVGACTASELPSADAALVADALAFGLWGQPPDEPLLRAAQDGELGTLDGLEAEVRRLIDDERGQAHLAAFGHWWLSQGQGREWQPLKDPELLPEFDATLLESMRSETDLFLRSLVSDPSATLGALLGADYTFANPALAALYDADTAGEEFQRIALDPELRAGLFTQAFFLSVTTDDRSDPIRRGFFLRERLLCTVVPAPPPVPQTVPAPMADDETTEAYLRRWLADPACRTCHEYGTWIGFGFEHYDALGRYRADERGLPIDSTALVILGDESREYPDAPSLLRDLATTEEVERCFAQHWLAFLLGREPRDASEALTRLELVPAACAQTGGESTAPVPCTELVTVASLTHRALECAVDHEGQLNLRELIVALATSETLMSRSFPCGERRCVSGFEYCFEYRPASTDGGGIEPTCYRYAANESGCDTSYASSPECSCAATAEGASVVCQQ